MSKVCIVSFSLCLGPHIHGRLVSDTDWDGGNPDPSYCHQQIREVLDSICDSFMYRR